MSEVSSSLPEKTDADEDAPKLIFSWRTPKINWRLHFIILASLLGHVFAFYVFRVIYPPAVRVTPQPTRVTLLQSSDPQAARFLRVLNDRSFSLGAGGGEEMTGEILNSRRAAFRPSFQGHEIALRDFPPSEPELSLPDLIRGDEIVLPQTKLSAQPAPPIPSPPAQPVIQLGPEFAGREIEIDSKLLEIVEAPGRRFRALVGVRADGGLQHLIIDEELEAPLPENFALHFRNALRFNRAAKPASGLKWGWIEISW
ncbi:MAG: hypothetical protein ACI8UO_000881 [Verrucomicrobiales bacterium]|jgi:hypothetical protein